MKTPLAATLAGSLLVALAGCGPSHPQSAGAEDAPPPVSHTVFAPYVNEVNKARNVQNVVNAQKQALDKEINNQTGAGSSTPAPAAQSP